MGGIFQIFIPAQFQSTKTKGDFMTDKKISVYFNMLDKNGFVFNGLHDMVTRITPAQVTQIVKRLEVAPHPMKKFGLCKMTPSVSGDKIDINRTFDAETLDDEDYIMMHCTGEWCNCPESIHKTCIKNLAAGKCKNKYMQYCVGEILFPHLYKNQKQR